MKLNLGCGFQKLPDFHNIDREVQCEPDQVVDLESTPWPWASNSVEEIHMIHVLEHLGQKTETYFAIIQEVYRICKPGAVIQITVPHPRHDVFLGDPTHVRPITIPGLAMFSKRLNREWIAAKRHESSLALTLDVDFEITKITKHADGYWAQKQARGEITIDELNFAEKNYNNVVIEMDITLEALKP